MKKLSWLSVCLLILMITLMSNCSQSKEVKQEVLSIFGNVYIMDNDGRLIPIDMGLAVQKRLALKWSPDGSMMSFTELNTVLDKKRGWIANSDGAEIKPITNIFDGVSVTWLKEDVLVTHVVTFTGEGLSEFESNDYIINLRDDSKRVYPHTFGVPYPLFGFQKWIAQNWNVAGGYSEGWFIHDLAGNRWPILETIAIVRLDVSPYKSDIVACGRWYENEQFSAPGLYYTTLDLTQNRTDEITLVYPETCDYPRWSPDGKYILLLANGNVEILDSTTFSLFKSFEVKARLADPGFVWEWSPDSKSIMVSLFYDGAEGEIYTPVKRPQDTKWKDLTRIYLESGKMVRLTRSEGHERLDDWRIIPKGFIND